MEDPKEVAAVEIIGAYLAHHNVRPSRLATLVREVYRALFIEEKAQSAGSHATSGPGLTTFDVQAVTVECLDRVRHTAEMRGLVLSLAVAPGTPREVTADPVWTRGVLLQLLAGAIEYTVKGAIEIRLQLMRDASRLRIQITDSGPGLSAARRRRVFETVKRLDRSAITRDGVLRVRIAQSAELIELQGGRVGYSDCPGGGNIFWLDLPSDPHPAHRQATGSMPESSDAQLASSASRALQLLIVDDDHISREFAAAVLEKAGHQVTCVDGGGQAIAAVEKRLFDLVLMDIRMPSMDGVEATRRIRALEGDRGLVPIVAVTAQRSPQHINRCHQAGMSGYVAKPFIPDELNATVLRTVSQTSPSFPFNEDISY